MRWIKYVLYKTGNWKPTKLNDMINILTRDKINVYEYSSKVSVYTSDIIRSIILIEELLLPDYTKEYVIKTHQAIPIATNLFIHHWYSDNRVMIGVDIFVNWLTIFKKINQQYEFGIKQDKTTLAYRNSVKIKFVIDEGSSVIKSIFK